MLIVKLVSIQDAAEDATRVVLFEVDGEQWYIPVTDLSTENSRLVREKAKSGTGDVGSPMPGVIVGIEGSGLEMWSKARHWRHCLP
jgi:pyruvate carboxylase